MIQRSKDFFHFCNMIYLIQLYFTGDGKESWAAMVTESCCGTSASA